jgi:hypothetical protein
MDRATVGGEGGQLVRAGERKLRCPKRDCDGLQVVVERWIEAP